MYLDPWMIALAVFMYGACAYFSRRSGVYFGANQTLDLLVKGNIITIDKYGNINPVSKNI